MVDLNSMTTRQTLDYLKNKSPQEVKQIVNDEFNKAAAMDAATQRKRGGGRSKKRKQPTTKEALDYLETKTPQEVKQIVNDNYNMQAAADASAQRKYDKYAAVQRSNSISAAKDRLLNKNYSATGYGAVRSNARVALIEQDKNIFPSYTTKTGLFGLTGTRSVSYRNKDVIEAKGNLGQTERIYSQKRSKTGKVWDK